MALAALALFAIARQDLSNMRALTTDTSFFTSQLAEVTRLEKEMLQFRADANAYVLRQGNVSKEQMLLSFDLLWSRLNTQWAKFVNPRIDALRNYQRDMKDFAKALIAIDSAVATETVVGASCRRSSVLRAVTMMSVLSVVSSAAACARATPGVQTVAASSKARSECLIDYFLHWRKVIPAHHPSL